MMERTDREKSTADRYEEACRCLPPSVKKAEAEGRREAVLSLTVSEGNLAGSKSCDVTTISVRAQGEKAGFAYTQNLEEDPSQVILRAAAGGELAQGETQIYEEAAGESAENAAAKKAAAKAVPEGLSNGEALANRNCVRTGMPAMLSPQEGFKFGAMVEKWALESDPSVSQATVTVSSCRTDNWVVNSGGLRREASHIWMDVAADMVLRRDGRTYNVTWSGSYPSKEDLSAAKESLQQSIRRNQAAKAAPVSFTSGVYRVLLSRESMCMIMVTLWKAFSGCHHRDGDSFLAGRMGQQVASGVFNMADVPFADGCGYSRRMDSEGVRAKENRLITDGVLAGRIHNLASAAYFGEEPTGNAGRAESFFSGLPTGRTAIPNVMYILPGEMKEQEALSCLGDGVWITETYDPFHSIEIASGEFAIPCNGVRVVDGRPVGALNSLTITGRLSELLMQIEAVGDTPAFWRFYTGLYYLGGPDVLVSRLQVNG